jgi:hypothetical protein
MKSFILKFVTVVTILICSLLAYSHYQRTKAWVISYEVSSGELSLSAASSGIQNKTYRGKTSMPETQGTWVTTMLPPDNIRVIFSDYTIQPGRVIFEIHGERFDLKPSGLSRIESK